MSLRERRPVRQEKGATRGAGNGVRGSQCLRRQDHEGQWDDVRDWGTSGLRIPVRVSKRPPTRQPPLTWQLPAVHTEGHQQNGQERQQQEARHEREQGGHLHLPAGQSLDQA